MAGTQQQQSDSLGEELQRHADDYQRGDDILQAEKTEYDGDGGQSQQRNVRELVARVDAGEGAKIIAVEGGGVGHAGIAEHQREDGREGGPHDEHGGETRGEAAVNALHHERHDVEIGVGLSGGIEFTLVRGRVLIAGNRIAQRRA